MPARRLMIPADLRRVVVVEELDLSLDGRLAVVVRRSSVGDRYVGHLFAIPLDGPVVPRPRALTRGIVRDTKPRLSADGRTLAFVRSDPRDEDAPAGLAVIDVDRARSVRRLRPGGHGAVVDLAWSPDGRRLAFCAEVDPPRFIVGDVPPAGRRHRGQAPGTPSPLARRITRADWRWDGEGHRDRWTHLFVLDRLAGRPRQITAGDWGVADIAWHPDGRRIAFSADLGPDPDLHPQPTIWSVDVDEVRAADGGLTVEPHEVLAAEGWASQPAWSPDGRWIAAVGLLEARPLDDLSPGLILAPADGSRPPHALDPELDRPIGNWVDSDLNGWMVSGRHGPLWLDERTILTTVSDRGRSHPYRFSIDPASGVLTDRMRLVEGDLTTHTLSLSARDRPGDRPDGAARLAFLATDGARAIELWTCDIAVGAGSGARRRSTFGSRWQDRLVVPDIRLVAAAGPGGPIDTWIVSPADAGEAALPTVVDVHGGPLGAWAPAPHLEVLLLASAGYRVVLPNIRGSATYGRPWIRAQLGDWGGVDAVDVHAALDHVIALGLADPNRLGVLGLSYGGFMVNWLVGTTDRFAAAVSENGVTNQVSDWANSDSGPEYDRASLLGDPFLPEGIEALWRQSPLRHVSSVRTPLLMLQAEADLRCPPYDNEQFFIALRHLRRTVEYVLYPDESHTYASTGRIDRRVDRMTRMLDWFDRHLR